MDPRSEATTLPGEAGTHAVPPTRRRDPDGAGHASATAAPAFVSRFGPLELDWPRSLGFFGGVWLAVAAGLVDPPLGAFIAAVPFIKMLDLPGLPRKLRIVTQVLEGVAKPVGGDSEGTVRLVTRRGASDAPVTSDS